MGKIIADIATMDPKIRAEAILYHLLPSRSRLVICHRCGQKATTEFIRVPDKGDLHIIMYPCTRVVIGIHPETRVMLEQEMNAGTNSKKEEPWKRKTVSFGFGDSYYFCEECVGWTIPELLAKATTKIQEGIIRKWDPIHDSSKPYVKEKGCWITVTEFPLTRPGRFLDYQTDFRNLIRILNATQLIGVSFL